MPNWKPQKKLSSWIKWGYEIDPHDPKQIIPIPELETLMDQAFDFIKTGEYSYRDISIWLSIKSKRDISHQALYNHWKRYRKAINRERWLRGQARKAEEKALQDSGKALDTPASPQIN